MNSNFVCPKCKYSMERIFYLMELIKENLESDCNDETKKGWIEVHEAGIKFHKSDMKLCSLQHQIFEINKKIESGQDY